SNPFWVDEKGIQVPYNRTTAFERKQEKTAIKIFKEAENLHNKLVVFKQQIAEECKEIYNAFLKENKVDNALDRKGNFTWHNFDRSIRIEVSVSERIEF